MLRAVRSGLQPCAPRSNAALLTIFRSICNSVSEKPLAQGDTFETIQLFDDQRVAQFVSVTGDANILHAAPEDEGSGTQGETSRGLMPLIPGSLCASLFPAIIGTTFPGALYLSQTLKFRKPALVGSKVRAVVTAKKVSGRRVVFETACHLMDSSGGPDIVIVDGEAVALMRSWNPQQPPESKVHG